ncbi:MAG TPA: serine hydrolase [Pyrinomonadaceae bacterium]|nr:serine hydrolase [Pyrinomonadaceae bacterium]
MKQLISKVLLFVYLIPTLTFGQSTGETQIKRVEHGLLPAVLIKGDPSWSIAERMKHYKVPALSVAVIKDFKIEWARAYGVKDLEANEPTSTETLFQAGSISKSVAAMVAMKKVEEGKISLDENINNKLTSWKLPDNEFTAKKKVTLKNLLSHTSGTTVHGFPGYAITEKVPTLEQVLDGAAPANTAPVRVDFEPGTRFRYSGGGTTIAQLAIMDIEKKPYPEIARETVLGPLNMTNSTYSQPLPADWRKKAATGYRSNGEEVEGKIHIYPEMAAAGLWTTPTDLAKFGIEVQLSLAGKSNKVLKKDSVDMMTKSFMDDAGLGFFVEKHGNALYFGHGGADEGFRAELLVSRDKGYGIAVMANSDNGQILREVIRSVAREYGWDEFLPAPYELISMTTAQLDGFTGRFQINPDRVLTITTEPGAVATGSNMPRAQASSSQDRRVKLIAQPTGDPSFELLPISETTFVRRDANIKYEFVRTAAKTEATNGGNGSSVAAAESLKLVTANATTEAKRISNDSLVPYELLLAGKTTEALEAYRAIKKEKPDNASVSENRLNNLGYVLMRQKKLPEAIALFKLNVEFYPKAWNTYDSLGEAYMTNGDKELAIANYKKSLELNPQNSNGREMLKKLEGK